MPIWKKPQNIKQIQVGSSKFFVLDKEKTHETQLLELKARKSLSLDEIKSLRELLSSNYVLLDKIIAYSENSAYVTGESLPEEVFFANLRSATIEQIASESLYYKKQLQNPDSFQLIVKNTNYDFNVWFNLYVKFHLVNSLEKYYTAFASNELKGNDEITIYETDIEKERKQTIQFIAKNYVDDVKAFLYWDWEIAVNKNKDYIEKAREKRESLIV